MQDLDYLRLAVEQAKESIKQGGFPAGAILVKDNQVVAKGISIGNLLHDPTAHAESETVRAACQVLKTTDLSGATLFASLEPCLMCFSATNWSGVSRIVYGCQKTTKMVNKHYYEGRSDIHDVNSKNTHQLGLVYLPDFENEMLALITEWEKQFI
jgi:tRNA(Arg) A34 adenosine deaminase TadA